MIYKVSDDHRVRYVEAQSLVDALRIALLTLGDTYPDKITVEKLADAL